MCDTYCKRRAGEQLASPGIKRVKVSIDEEAATSTKQDTTNVSANERLQPCADFENYISNVEPTSIQYCGKITLQPEELLLYALVNVSVPPGTNLARCSPEKYAGISFAIYKVYGVCFKCKHIQNYYYRSINNLSKGLGKFNGCLRWKFYSNYIERIVSKHQQTIHSLFLDSSLNSDIQNFDDFKKDLEAECLSSLAENERSQSLAYKVDKLSCTIEMIADVDKSEMHLFYLDNSHIVYEIVIQGV